MESGYLSSIFERSGEKFREEGIEKGIEKGKLIGLDMGVELGEHKGDEKRAIFVARWMLEKGMSIDDIREATNLSMEKINSLKGK